MPPKSPKGGLLNICTKNILAGGNDSQSDEEKNRVDFRLETGMINTIIYR